MTLSPPLPCNTTDPRRGARERERGEEERRRKGDDVSKTKGSAKGREGRKCELERKGRGRETDLLDLGGLTSLLLSLWRKRERKRGGKVSG